MERVRAGEEGLYKADFRVIVFPTAGFYRVGDWLQDWYWFETAQTQ